MFRLSKTGAIGWFTLACVLTACGQLRDNGVSGTVAGNGGTSGTTTTVATVNAGLFFNVAIAWDTLPGDKSTILSNCQIPVGAAPGTVANCNVAVPEGQLHFGNLTFTIGSAAPSTCYQIEFYPYAYQASATPNYKVPTYASSFSATDCTPPAGSTISPGPCYDGAATFFYSDYPVTTHTYFTTNNAAQADFNLPSAASKKKPFNTWAANAISNGAAPDDVTFPQSATMPHALYVANTMTPYIAVCRDRYYENIYQINLTIQSVPYVGSGVLSWPGWH